MLRTKLIGLVALAMVSVGAMGVLTTARADDPTTTTSERPTVKPGWPDQGSLRVTGCTANAANPVCEVTKEGPFGPITLRVEYSEGFRTGGRSAFTYAARTCHATWNGGYPSYWYEMWTPFNYDFSTVTSMGSTYYDDHSIPLFGWGDHQAYNDWQSGWQYAWGNVRADLTYGWPFSADIGNLHMNILVDAWGNCTPDSEFNWF